MPRRKRTTAMCLALLEPGALVFVYLRDSGGAAQERSVSEQRVEVQRWCDERGLAVVGWFIDEARASGDYARRDEFMALLDACRVMPAPVAAVVVYDLSRFGRDEYDGPFYRLELRRHGVDVVSVSEVVPAGNMGAIVETFIDWKNRVFLDDLSRTVRRGLRANAVAGYAPGGVPPRGYRAVRVQAGVMRDGRPRWVSQWVVDEQVAPRVRRAFELAAAGVSYREIHAATGLYAGSPGYAAMLRNRSYLGLYKLGDEEFPGPEALATPELFEQVQARMVSRSEHARVARRVSSEYLLSGLVWCADCGVKMVGNHSMYERRGGEISTWRYYRCRTPGCTTRRVSTVVVEGFVLGQVLDQVLTVANMARVLEELRVQLRDVDAEGELLRLDREIVVVRRAGLALVEQVEQGLGGQMTRERLAARENELARLEGERRVLARRVAVARVEINEVDLRARIDELRTGVSSDVVAVARRALQQIIERVEVDHGGVIEIAWRSS